MDVPFDSETSDTTPTQKKQQKNKKPSFFIVEQQQVVQFKEAKKTKNYCYFYFIL